MKSMGHPKHWINPMLGTSEYTENRYFEPSTHWKIPACWLTPDIEKTQYLNIWKFGKSTGPYACNARTTQFFRNLEFRRPQALEKPNAWTSGCPEYEEPGIPQTLKKSNVWDIQIYGKSFFCTVHPLENSNMLADPKHWKNATCEHLEMREIHDSVLGFRSRYREV